MAQDTTMFLSANACRVHLAVILTVESSPGRLDKPLYAVSGVIKDGSKCYLQSFWYQCQNLSSNLGPGDDDGTDQFVIVFPNDFVNI